MNARFPALQTGGVASSILAAPTISVDPRCYSLPPDQVRSAGHLRAAGRPCELLEFEVRPFRPTIFSRIAKPPIVRPTYG